MNWFGIEIVIGFFIGMFYIAGGVILYDWWYKKKNNGECPFCERRKIDAK